MGPLGLSGSLFLGLMVFDFYHLTNCDHYLVGGEGGVVLCEFLIFSIVVLDLFKKCLGFVFNLKGPTFGSILSFKGR